MSDISEENSFFHSQLNAAVDLIKEGKFSQIKKDNILFKYPDLSIEIAAKDRLKLSIVTKFYLSDNFSETQSLEILKNSKNLDLHNTIGERYLKSFSDSADSLLEALGYLLDPKTAVKLANKLTERSQILLLLEFKTIKLTTPDRKVLMDVILSSDKILLNINKSFSATQNLRSIKSPTAKEQAMAMGSFLIFNKIKERFANGELKFYGKIHGNGKIKLATPFYGFEEVTPFNTIDEDLVDGDTSKFRFKTTTLGREIIIEQLPMEVSDIIKFELSPSLRKISRKLSALSH